MTRSHFGPIFLEHSNGLLLIASAVHVQIACPSAAFLLGVATWPSRTPDFLGTSLSDEKSTGPGQLQQCVWCDQVTQKVGWARQCRWDHPRDVPSPNWLGASLVAGSCRGPDQRRSWSFRRARPCFSSDWAPSTQFSPSPMHQRTHGSQ